MEWDDVNTTLRHCFGLNIKGSRLFRYFGDNIHCINERYMPPLTDYIEAFPPCQPQMLCVKSAMGTGKSSRFFEYIANGVPSAIIISSRITYTNFMCSKGEGGETFENYQNLDKYEIDYINHPKVVVQYQSLCRIRDIRTTENFAKWEVCFLDEFDSILKEALSSTMTKRKKALLIRIFSKLVTAIKTVIVCDANMSEWHFDFLLNHLLMVPRAKQAVVLNSNRGLFEDQTRVLRVYTACSLSPFSFSEFVATLKQLHSTKTEKEPIKDLIKLEQKLRRKQDRAALGEAEDAYMKILLSWYRKRSSSNILLDNFIRGDASHQMVDEVVTKEKNVVAVCATKSLAQYIYSFFVKYAGLKEDTDVILLTGDSDCEYKRKLSADSTMKTMLAKCRVFIYTSCFKVGVDISFKRFDSVYLFLAKISTTSPLNVSDVYQMVGRVRKYNALIVCIENLPKKKKEEFTVLRDIRYKCHDDLAHDDTIEYLTGKVATESRLKIYPRLYIRCLLKLLVDTMNSPRLSYAGEEVSSVVEINKNLVNYRTRHVFSNMIVSYEPFKQRIENLYGRICNAIMFHLANKTPLFSFDMFRAYADLAATTERSKVKEVFFMATLLTTFKGVMAACSELNEMKLQYWYRIYRQPTTHTFGDIESFVDVKYDFRMGESQLPETHCVDLVTKLLYRLVKTYTADIEYSEFIKLIPDIRAVVKHGSREKNPVERLYAMFINEYVPSDYDYVLEVVCKQLVDRVPDWIDINKFLIFAVI